MRYLSMCVICASVMLFTVSCKTTKKEAETKVTTTEMNGVKAEAKNTGSQEQRDKMRAQVSKKLFDRLQMTGVQQTEYYAIIDKYKPKMDKIRAKTKDRKDLMKKVSDLRSKQTGEIMGILDDGQKVKYQSFLDGKKTRRGTDGRPY